ncbi:Edc3p [Rhodotorula paludigena]|uniref:Edc3p n=1 Tax=Rhodotorula paludigena TaxID=86838 RepID=UPI00317546B0
MANAFVGLPVLVKLRSGPNDAVKGVLSSLDPAAGTLTLTEARTTVGGVERLEGIRVLSRNEVAGLELLSVSRSAQPAPTQPPVPRPNVHHAQQGALAPSPIPSPSPLSASPKPDKPRRTRGARSNKHNRVQSNSRETEEGNEADLSSAYHDRRPKHPHHHSPGLANAQPLAEDFDFSAGLASFDKRKVFEQIKSNDATDPSLRLHAHNRNPDRVRTPQSKLLPTESVLSPNELYEQQQERLAARHQLASAAVGASESARATPTDMSRARQDDAEDEQRAEERWEKVQKQLTALEVDEREGGNELRTAKTRLAVPVIKARQWREALSIAEIESCPTPAQRLEASAHGLTIYVLSTLARTHKLFPVPSPPHSRPSICFLCTDSEKGYIGLRAGVTLANRGCRVVVLAEDGTEGRSERWRTGLRVLSSAGGRIVRDPQDLPPAFNLVTDALGLDSDPLSSSVTSPRLDAAPSFASPHGGQGAFASSAASWASALDAPLLSLDVPFGIDSDSGASTAEPSLRPTHLLAFGLPRQSALALARAGGKAAPALALADVGFPPSVWERVGVEGFDRATFGADAVVELERA